MSGSADSRPHMADRAEQIQQILEACIDRRANGERVSDEALTASFPELEPDLGAALRD